MAGLSIPGLTPVYSANGLGAVIPSTTPNAQGYTPQQREQMAALEASRPQFVTSPTGAVYRSDPANGDWDPVGQVDPYGGGGGGGSSRASGSGGGSNNNAALDALLAEIKNQSLPTITPTHVTPSKVSATLSPAQNAATYGAAKERIGLEGQAAMRGLRSSLAARGIVGTGIDAEETGKVYSGMQSGLSTVNRQLATDDAERMRQADQTNAATTNQASQFNASQDMAAAQANLQAQAQRNNMLIQLASLY